MAKLGSFYWKIGQYREIWKFDEKILQFLGMNEIIFRYKFGTFW